MAKTEEWGKPVERRGVSLSPQSCLFGVFSVIVCFTRCPPPHRQRLTTVLVLATLISAFGSSFQYGYNVAVINSPSPVTEAKRARFYTLRYRGRHHFQCMTTCPSLRCPALFSSCSISITPPTWSGMTNRWRTTSSLCCGLSRCPCIH